MDPAETSGRSQQTTFSEEKHKLILSLTPSNLNLFLIDYLGEEGKPHQYELQISQSAFQTQFSLKYHLENIEELYYYLSDRNNFELQSRGKLVVKFAVWSSKGNKTKTVILSLKAKEVTQADQVLISLHQFKDQIEKKFETTAKTISVIQTQIQTNRIDCFEKISQSLFSFDEKISNLTSVMNNQKSQLQEKLSVQERNAFKPIIGRSEDWKDHTDGYTCYVDVDISEHNFATPPIVQAMFAGNTTGHTHNGSEHIHLLTPKGFRVYLKTFTFPCGSYPICSQFLSQSAKANKFVLHYTLTPTS